MGKHRWIIIDALGRLVSPYLYQQQYMMPQQSESPPIRIRLKNGKTVEGYVVSQDDKYIMVLDSRENRLVAIPKKSLVVSI